MPSARLPPTTGAPEKESVQTLLAPRTLAVGLDHDAVVPLPAPLRPTSVNAPAPRTTDRSKVTVTLLTLDRWALPSLTWTDVTAGTSVGSTVPGVPFVMALGRHPAAVLRAAVGPAGSTATSDW